MKPLKSSNKLVSSVNNTTSFKMETSAETFEIFSSQIYEHKIRAIIRELSCNAYDAHVDAGKREVPFRIHFPTMFEPFFEVEDYGVGLDDYDIRGEEKVLYDENGDEVQRYMEGGIYTTYFASTKRESNESIGHLGLGSKSPMAYTKSMTVVARKNGVERHYVCFIGEDGQPQTTFNSEKETTEGNGVKIRFSVAQSDFEEFRREASFVLSLFKVQPETNSEIEPLLSAEEFDELNTNGVLLVDQYHPFVRHESAIVYANMGGVVYPVRNVDYFYLGQTILVNEDEYNTGEAEEAIYHKFDNNTVAFIKNTIDRGGKRLIVNFDIGSLSFMPSREGLSQDTKTKFNFYKGLVDVFYEKVAELNDRINESRNALEAVASFSEFAPPTDMFAYDYQYDGKSIAHWAITKTFTKLKTYIKDEVDASILDKLVCHYHDTVGWYGRTNNTCVRRKTIFGLENIIVSDWINEQGTFDVFYGNSKDDFRGLSKAIRFYANSFDVNTHRFFVLYETEKLDDTVFETFKDCLCDRVNFRHISEIVDEVKFIEPEFFSKKARGKNAGPKVTKKNQTKAQLVTWNKKKKKYVFTDGQVLVNMDSINPNSSAWVAKIPLSSNYRVEVNGESFTLSPNNLKDLMIKFGINVMVVANGKNRSKIERSGLANFDLMIEKQINDNKDEIIKSYAWNEAKYAFINRRDKTTMEMLVERACGFMHTDTFKYLYDNDEFTKAHVDVIVEAFDQFVTDNKYDNELYTHLYKFIDYDAVYKQEKNLTDFKDDKIEEFRYAYEIIKKRYPLIFGVDSDSAAVLEYVELINEKYNEETKTEEAA